MFVLEKDQLLLLFKAYDAMQKMEGIFDSLLGPGSAPGGAFGKAYACVENLLYSLDTPEDRALDTDQSYMARLLEKDLTPEQKLEALLSRDYLGPSRRLHLVTDPSEDRK